MSWEANKSKDWDSQDWNQQPRGRAGTPRSTSKPSGDGEWVTHSKDGTVSNNTYKEETPSKGSGQPSKGVADGLQTACCSCLVGIVLYWGCLAGIAWNEVTTVCVTKALHSASIHHENVGCAAKDAADRQGQLIFFDCPVSSRSLKEFKPQSFDQAHWLDGAFTENAVKMHQEVSMYQCAETKKTKEEKRGEETKTVTYYEYNLKWVSRHIDHTKFVGWQKNEAWEAVARGCGSDFKGNPLLPMKSQSVSSNLLFAGDFDVTRHLSKVSINQPVTLKEGWYTSPSGTTPDGRNNKRVASDGKAYSRAEFIEFYGQDRGIADWEAAAKPEGSASKYAEVSGNTVSTCSGGASAIGCMRVTYTRSGIAHISHMAELGKMKKTKAWHAPTSWMCPSSGSANTVDFFVEGSRPAEGLIKNAQDDNSFSTWVIRVVCFILVIVGFFLFLQPIQAIANYADRFLTWFKFIPVLGWGLDFLGNVVAGAVHAAIIGISIGIGAPSACLVFSISWLLMRPMIGVPMVILCAVFLGMTAKAMADYAKVGKTKRKNWKKTA